MKILHTSDWHLGRIIYNRSLLEDQDFFVRQVFLKTVKREKPDLVIIAGDIFDRQIAPVEALRLFGYAVSQLCNMGVPTAVIAGNHDGADRLAVYSDLLREKGLYIAARPFDMPPIRLEDGKSELWVHLLPHFDPVLARDIMGDDSIHGFNESYRAVLNQLTKDFQKSERHLLVSHCFIKGSQICDSESPVSVGGSGEVESSLFEPFRYVALGHLHGPQRAGRNACYSGSPLKYSFDEQNHSKSMIMIEFDGEAEPRFMRLPCVSLRNMRTIKGSIREIIDKAANDDNREDYIYAELTDRRPVFEPMALLRECYPNILGLHPGWLDMDPGNGDSRDELRTRLRKNNAGDQLFYEEFLKQVCGIEPTQEELGVFRTVMKRLDGKEAAQ